MTRDIVEEIWGTNSGRITIPSSSYKKEGHGGAPKTTDSKVQNYQENKHDSMADHNSKNGIPLWEATETYPINSLCLLNGITYISLQAGNINKNPLNENIWWTAQKNLPYNNIAKFPSSGTWTLPDGITKAFVRVWGGGGGGGAGDGGANAGTGAGGGGYTEEYIDTLTIDVTITVGVGGNGGVNGGASAVDGGNSSFGAFCSATGGIKGLTSNGAGKGAGGGGANGDLNIRGSQGTGSIDNTLGGDGGGGGNGSGGGGGAVGIGSDGGGGGNPAGGGGGGGQNGDGGDGGDGLVIIYY